MAATQVTLCLCLLLCYFAASEVIISVEPQHQGTGLVKYSIKNTLPHAIQVLSYGTPFDGNVFFSFLNITSQNGDVAPYTGALARYVFPAPAESYLTIPANSVLSTSVDVSEHFDIISNGFYNIHAVLPPFNPTLVNAVIDEPIAHRLAVSVNNNARAVANKYQNCNANEQSQIASATTTAINQAKNSKNCMSAKSCNSLSQKWFGATPSVNAAYYNFDSSVFTNIYNTLSSNGINAYCNPAGCGPSVYAYVYPTDKSQTVYLCGAFWSVPSERANTIVHEMSHFNVIGGTQDYAYGEVPCINLAKANPYQASHNADNVCFFSAAA